MANSRHFIVNTRYWLPEEQRTDYDSWMRDFGLEVAKDPSNPDHVLRALREYALTFVQA